MRVMVGFGSGGAYTEMDGDIVDAASGEVLVHFRNAKRRSFGMFGGSYEKLLADCVDNAGQNLGVLLLAFTGKR